MSVDWREMLQRLSARFPEGEEKTYEGPVRNGKALLLTYIDARCVEDRLDEVVGPEHWGDVYADFGDQAQRAVQCHLTIHGVTKSGIGYPNSAGDDEPYKAAESDALKRAAVKFGIGRYLYALPPQWVEPNSTRRGQPRPQARNDAGQRPQQGQQRPGGPTSPDADTRRTQPLPPATEAEAERQRQSAETASTASAPQVGLPDGSPHKAPSANQLATIAKLRRLLGVPEEPTEGMTSAEASEIIAALCRDYNARKGNPAGGRGA